MPRYYCDYCDIYLTHDAPGVRDGHCSGRRHKEAVRDWYMQWEDVAMEKQMARGGPVPPSAAGFGQPSLKGFPPGTVLPPPGMGAPGMPAGILRPPPPSFAPGRPMPPPGFPPMPPPGAGSAGRQPPPQ